MKLWIFCDLHLEVDKRCFPLTMTKCSRPL